MTLIAITYLVFGLACFMLGRLTERRKHLHPVTPLQRALVSAWGNSVRRAHMIGALNGWHLAKTDAAQSIGKN